MADSDALHDLLQCSICLDRFTNPKVLPCQHTFCLNCLRGITRGLDILSCPECRKDHRIPQNGVVDLEDNLTIKRLLSMIGEVAACNDCGQNLSLSKCQHCAELICGDCRAVHAELFAEINLFFNLYDEDKVPAEKCSEEVLWKDLLDRVIDGKERISNAFANLELDLAKRRDKMQSFLDILEKRIRILANENRTEMVQDMRQQLVACKTNQALNEFRHLLRETERVLATVTETGRGEDLAITHAPDLLKDFVNISCGHDIIDIDINPDKEGGRYPPYYSKTCLSAGSNRVENSESPGACEEHVEATSAPVASLPCNVDYRAKNSTLKLYIDHHPKSLYFEPIQAFYCSALNAVCCLALYPEGVAYQTNLLLYRLDGHGGRMLSQLMFSAEGIALSDSGKVMVVEGSVITILDLMVRQNENSKIALLVESVDKIPSSASQICCYKNEFAVPDPDPEKKSFSIFSEEGEFVREFSAEQIKCGRNLAIGAEGKIYLSNGERVVEREESGELKGCRHNRKHSSVIIHWVIEFAVFSWEGAFLHSIDLACPPKTYNYEFDYDICACCDRGNRNIVTVPENETFLEKNYLCKFCVDGDGFICITKSESDVIEVYDQKGQLHCTIGDQQYGAAGFKNPSGVSLMPDGRLIVCDAGNNRIQII